MNPAPPPQLFRSPASVWEEPWVLTLVAGFLLLVLFGSRLINDSDMGFHLRTGQWILENHRVPSNDAYTYTVSNHFYLDLEWLYQIQLYLVYLTGGYKLLSITHIFFILLAFAFVWKRMDGGNTPFEWKVLFILMAILASESRCRVRPEVFSWVLLAILFWVLEDWFKKGKNRLFLLPILLWIWANTEGLFWIGLGLIVIYGFSGMIHQKKWDKKFLLWSGLSFLACLANPYFLRGFLFPLELLEKMRMSGSNVFKSAVGEFNPSWSLSFQGLGPSYLLVYKFFCFLFLILLLSTFRRRKIHECVLCLVFFALSYSAVRNISIFMIACAPIALNAAWDLLAPGWNKVSGKFVFRQVVPWLMMMFLLLFGVRWITNAHFISNRLNDRYGLGLDDKSQPVQGCEFLIRNHLDGKIINTLDEGDWLDWQGPQKTFIDGRLEAMGEEFFTEYTLSLNPGGLSILLSKYRPDILFFNPLHAPQWVMDLQGMPDWRLVYVDGVTGIYLRKGYAEPLPALDFDSLLAVYGIQANILGKAEEILRQLSSGGLAALLQPKNYPDGLQNLGLFCARSGHTQEAVCFLLEAIRVSRGSFSDLYFNLGSLLCSLDPHSPEGIYCMRRVLEAQPDNALAREFIEF